MDKFMQELRSGLTENTDVSVRNEQQWQLPVVVYDVSFSRVKRLKMDILMKMLLLVFQETPIRRAATLADMLFVEELFIRDLIGKMERAHLIKVDSKGYQLTDKGYDYLEQGIFEEEMDDEETMVVFNAVHDEYRITEREAHPASENELPLYRYAMEEQADKERILSLLSEEKNAAEENYQVLVTDISELEESHTEFIPCIEFQLYDGKQDIFYVRIWNTGTGSWDETLEKQIEEKELVIWREEMEKEELGA